MEIKKILSEKEFKDFEDAVVKIKLDYLIKTENDPDFRRKNISTYIDVDKVVNDNTLFKRLANNYHNAKNCLENLYKKHEDEYVDMYEFERELFNNLKGYVSNQAVLASKNELPKRKLTTEEAVKYEEARNLYIQMIRSIDKGHADSQLIAESLKTLPLEILADYVDKVEKVVEERYNKPNNNSPRMAILHDYLSTIVPFSSTYGNNLVTQKIDINTTRLKGSDPKFALMPTHLKALAFLENQLLLSDTGLDKQNIGFDGYRFFNTITNSTILSSTLKLNLTFLSTADISKQSNFVLDEDFADMLISIHKVHRKVTNKNVITSVQEVDGDTIITTKTLFKPVFDDLPKARRTYVQLCMGLGHFCKVKEYNKTKNTFNIELYYFADPNSTNGIQLLRLDKVADMFKGKPASHNLRGKEKIETTMHIHKYNLVDAVLKNYQSPDSLGKMDISYNFISVSKPNIYAAEELFNNKCGIYNKALNNKNRKFFERKPPLPDMEK